MVGAQACERRNCTLYVWCMENTLTMLHFATVGGVSRILSSFLSLVLNLATPKVDRSSCRSALPNRNIWATRA